MRRGIIGKSKSPFSIGDILVNNLSTGDNYVYNIYSETSTTFPISGSQRRVADLEKGLLYSRNGTGIDIHDLNTFQLLDYVNISSSGNIDYVRLNADMSYLIVNTSGKINYAIRTSDMVVTSYSNTGTVDIFVLGASTAGTYFASGGSSGFTDCRNTADRNNYSTISYCNSVLGGAWYSDNRFLAHDHNMCLRRHYKNGSSLTMEQSSTLPTKCYHFGEFYNDYMYFYSQANNGYCRLYKINPTDLSYTSFTIHATAPTGYSGEKLVTSDGILMHGLMQSPYFSLFDTNSSSLVSFNLPFTPSTQVALVTTLY